MEMQNRCHMDILPKFLQEIQGSERVLIAGAGGGFDIYAGIPLFFSLTGMGKEVYLASYTLSNVEDKRWKLDQFDKHCSIITASSAIPKGVYCPEKYLADYLKTQGLEMDIFTFHRVGPKLLAHTYQALVRDLKLDTVILLDGGNDSLMRGDEVGLGTPVEDMTSIVAAQSVQARKYLVCLGITVDYFHGVADKDNWKAMAELIKLNGFKGAFALDKNSPSVKKYIELVNFANQEKENYQSIVQNSIVSALNGEFGDIHRTPRTRGSELQISPIMGQYWCFDLQTVYNRVLYAKEIENLKNLSEVNSVISQFIHRERNFSTFDTDELDEKLQRR
ncbi:MAG: DUF1152 domain-containing protein [Candidatus Heimdallarchaeota archaeon]|nr:DUF1152 domain-containing protein [Candidatus Heimdallarchaeota archaeon]